MEELLEYYVNLVFWMINKFLIIVCYQSQHQNLFY
jgi:hypothetical protein